MCALTFKVQGKHVAPHDIFRVIELKLFLKKYFKTTFGHFKSTLDTSCAREQKRWYRQVNILTIRGDFIRRVHTGVPAGRGAGVHVEEDIFSQSQTGVFVPYEDRLFPVLFPFASEWSQTPGGKKEERGETWETTTSESVQRSHSQLIMGRRHKGDKYWPCRDQG